MLYFIFLLLLYVPFMLRHSRRALAGEWLRWLCYNHPSLRDSSSESHFFHPISHFNCASSPVSFFLSLYLSLRINFIFNYTLLIAETNGIRRGCFEYRAGGCFGASLLTTVLLLIALLRDVFDINSRAVAA